MFEKSSMTCEDNDLIHEHPGQSISLSRDNQREVFELSDVEIETLRRAAIERGLPFDRNRRTYLNSELVRYGIVREGYTREELRRLGFGSGPVSCFDDSAKRAEDLLRVEAPFGSGIKKWQLPINALHMRMEQTLFPPNTSVTPHVHPENSPDDPGGGLRIIIKGKIFYKGMEYGPGDWFYVPNGVSYSFTTDPELPTIVMYKYRFFGDEHENRFSHPSKVEADDDTHSCNGLSLQKSVTKIDLKS